MTGWIVGIALGLVVVVIVVVLVGTLITTAFLDPQRGAGGARLPRAGR